MGWALISGYLCFLIFGDNWEWIRKFSLLVWVNGYVIAADSITPASVCMGEDGWPVSIRAPPPQVTAGKN